MNKSVINSQKFEFAKGRAELLGRKYGPTIMVVAGIASVVTSTIMACKSTIKAKDIINEANSDLDKVEEARHIANTEDYTDKDYKTDKFKVFAQTGLKLAKVYGPSFALGVGGLSLILGSHKIMTDRNNALSSAYILAQRAFDQYRERVVEKYGSDADKALRYGIEKHKDEVVDEDGKKHKEEHEYVSADGISQYARVFDEYCPSFSDDPAANLVFLRQQQNWANDLLRSRGHLFLNEVYDALGFDRTAAGQIVGWVYDPKNPDIDNTVDFGIYDKLYVNEAKRDFINGHNPCVLLDFNVDGPIYDKLDQVYSKSK